MQSFVCIHLITSNLKAVDKGAAIASFSQFCKSTVNEEEEIAHKLLGREFHVSQLTSSCYVPRLKYCNHGAFSDYIISN